MQDSWCQRSKRTCLPGPNLQADINFSVENHWIKHINIFQIERKAQDFSFPGEKGYFFYYYFFLFNILICMFLIFVYQQFCTYANSVTGCSCFSKNNEIKRRLIRKKHNPSFQSYGPFYNVLYYHQTFTLANVHTHILY